MSFTLLHCNRVLGHLRVVNYILLASSSGMGSSKVSLQFFGDCPVFFCFSFDRHTLRSFLDKISHSLINLFCGPY